MDRSTEASSDYSSSMYSRFESRYAANGRRGARDGGYATDGAQEDLFLNIAADSAQRENSSDAMARSDRLKVRNTMQSEETPELTQTSRALRGRPTANRPRLWDCPHLPALPRLSPPPMAIAACPLLLTPKRVLRIDALRSSPLLGPRGNRCH